MRVCACAICVMCAYAWLCVCDSCVCMFAHVRYVRMRVCACVMCAYACLCVCDVSVWMFVRVDVCVWMFVHVDVCVCVFVPV